MKIETIKQRIRQAEQQELKSPDLHHFICEQLPTLHLSIKLPEHEASQKLTQFARQYISHAPDFIRVLIEISKKVGISSYISPVINIIEGIFLPPVGNTNTVKEEELIALLSDTYFFYRILEEMNDYYRTKTGVFLISVNLNQANLIIHSTLGEPFANELDNLVEKTMMFLMAIQGNQKNLNSCLSLTNNFDGYWCAVNSKWETLLQQTGIDLVFTPAA